MLYSSYIYYTATVCTSLSYIMIQCIVPYDTLRYYTILYFTILYCTILYYIDYIIYTTILIISYSDLVSCPTLADSGDFMNTWVYQEVGAPSFPWIKCTPPEVKNSEFTPEGPWCLDVLTFLLNPFKRLIYTFQSLQS